MILNKKPLALAEIKQYIKDSEDKKATQDYLKNFVKVSKADAEKMAKELKELNNPKIKDEYIVKVVDFLPKDSEDVNKIFIDTSLSEEEANAISEIVKKY